MEKKILQERKKLKKKMYKINLCKVYYTGCLVILSINL